MIISRRFESGQIIRLVVVLQAVGLLAGVLWTGYAGATYSEVISFSVDDGWCNTPNEGVGQHCFGDYTSPFLDVADGEIYEVAQPLPPSTLAFHSLFGLVGHLTVYGVGLTLWLLAGFLGLVVAAVVISRRMNAVSSSQVLLALILAWPVVAAVDRGTSVLFLVPLVALAIFAEADGRHRSSLILIACTALIRPQFLVCIFALNFRRQIQVLCLFVTAQFLTSWLLNDTQEWFYSSLQVGKPWARLKPWSPGTIDSLSGVLDKSRHATGWISGLVEFESSSPLQSDLSKAFAHAFPGQSSTGFVIAVAVFIGLVRAIRGPVAGLSTVSLCALMVCASQASSTSPVYYYAVILVSVLSYAALRGTVGVPDLLVLVSVSVPVITRVGVDEWRLVNSPILGGMLILILGSIPWFVFKWDKSTNTVGRGP